MKHDSLVNLPLAVVWMSMPWWLNVFEQGSWFFATLLPYFGMMVACLQLYLIFRNWRRP